VGEQDGYAALDIRPQPLTPWLPVLLQGSRRQQRLDRYRAMR